MPPLIKYMDRNNIIGFALIFVVLMLWSYFNTKQTQQQLVQKRIQDSIDMVQAREDSLRKLILNPEAATIESTTPSATNGVVPVTHLPTSIFNTDSAAKPGEYILENDVIKLTFNSLGGKITKAELKKYFKMVEMKKGPDLKTPLYLLDNPRNDWNLRFELTGAAVQTKDIVFKVENPTAHSIKFMASTASGQQIIQTYNLGNSYSIDYTIDAPGLNALMPNPTATLQWQNILDAKEKGVAYEKTRTTTHYKPLNEREEHLKFGGDDEEAYAGAVKWIANIQQFFNTSIIADQSFKNIKVAAVHAQDPTEYLAKLNTSADISLENNESAKLRLFIGPNEYKLLENQGNDLEDIIAFGASILGTVNRWIVRPVFNFLSGFFSNKGIVILLLTFIVKLILFPLSYKMLHSQAKMGALKPEMAHLKDKFKDDAQGMQVESMKMYREYGVNPLGGCLPMVLQMPIWLALYQFFPASIEFRQSSFLWANDLSSYDVFAKLPMKLPFYGSHVSLFTLIWVVSTLIFTHYSTKDQDFSVNPAMKYMQYLMPLFFLFFFNNSASGLTAYMAFSNILNIIQTVGGKALFFPLPKMQAELQASRNKPKKKGGFQDRLESMMKEQQQKLDQKTKQGKK